MYPFQQICVFTLLNMRFHFTAHAFPPPFRGCLRICGHDKSVPYSCKRSANNVANIPQTPNKHSARRRGRFIVPVSLHFQKCVSISTNMCFYIIKYAFPFHRTRISVPPFGGCFRICGHYKSAPTAADSLPIMLEQIAIYTRTPTKNHTFALRKTILLHYKKPLFAPRKTILSHHKYPIFALQKPYFRTAITHFSHAKNLSATNWEGRKNVLLKSSLPLKRISPILKTKLYRLS